MPNRKKGEPKEVFMKRCVKQLKDEGKSTEQAVAICYSLAG